MPNSSSMNEFGTEEYFFKKQGNVELSMRDILDPIYVGTKI
jgi:hypothetical protein